MTNKKKFWRLCPFKKGDVLKVSRDVAAKSANFQKDEILIFLTADISHYRGMTAFTFRSETGENKTFDMLDTDGIGKLSEIFHVTEDKPASKRSFSLFEVLIMVALCGVLLKVAMQLSFVEEAFRAAPLYAAGACVLGLLAYYLIKILKR